MQQDNVNTHSYDMYDQTEKPGVPFPMETHKIIAHRYFFAAQYIKDKEVLEIGSGAGLGLPVLTRHAKNTVGGEYSAENIEILKQAGNDICPLLRLDAHKLPFADNSFDVIVAMAMVYYLDVPAFVAEARRVLKPGGILFFDSSNKDMPGFWPSPYIKRYYSVPELAALLQEAGYEVSFYGAFAEGQGLLLRHVKAFVKDTIKRLICLLPGGRSFWQRLRVRAQADTAPLPDSIEAVDCQDVIVETLAAEEVNRRHRVIYVVAKCPA